MNKLALFTAAGAALMMISGVALAQTSTQPPSSTGASKSHMGNSDPAKSTTAKSKKAKKPATGQNGQVPKGGKNKSGE